LRKFLLDPDQLNDRQLANAYSSTHGVTHQGIKYCRVLRCAISHWKCFYLCVHTFDLFRPSVTLTFDLLTTKVDRFIYLLHWSLAPICSKIRSYFFRKSVFTRLTTEWEERANKLTDRRTDGRTDGQVDNIMPPASLHWRRRHKYFIPVWTFCQFRIAVLMKSWKRQELGDRKILLELQKVYWYTGHACIEQQLPDSFRQPSQSCLDSSHSLVNPYLSSSPLSPSITSSLFHSRLKASKPTFSTNPSHLKIYFFTDWVPSWSWDWIGVITLISLFFSLFFFLFYIVCSVWLLTARWIHSIIIVSYRIAH